MEETKKTPARNPKKKAALVVFVLIIVSMLFLAGFGMRVFQFGFSTVACGHLPVVGTKFLTSTYYLPEDSRYGPSPFGEYFCTEQQAVNAGYSRDPFARMEHE